MQVHQSEGPNVATKVASSRGGCDVCKVVQRSSRTADSQCSAAEGRQCIVNTLQMCCFLFLLCTLCFTLPTKMQQLQRANAAERPDAETSCGEKAAAQAIAQGHCAGRCISCMAPWLMCCWQLQLLPIRVLTCNRSGIRLCDRFKGATCLMSAGNLAYAAMCLRTAGWHPTSSGQGSSYWQDMPQQQHQRIASGTSVSAAAVLK